MRLTVAKLLQKIKVNAAVDDCLLYRPLDHSARGCESRTAVLRRAYDGGLADGRNQLLVCARAASLSGAAFGSEERQQLFGQKNGVARVDTRVHAQSCLFPLGGFWMVSYAEPKQSCGCGYGSFFEKTLQQCRRSPPRGECGRFILQTCRKCCRES